ncbi:MAG: DJ-1/PfpI family protein, partial [Henriciella sp.]|uniref:DJ-1/PfpI family protein n=1 Tax=Henriciella sp. TaxID=1968823 RepID=UPI003C70F15D
TGPAQVLSRLGNVTLDLVWKTREPVATDSGFALLPTKTFDEAAYADILCVPGGFGTVDVMQDAAALDWVRRIGASADWVTSVCTGALVLGAAGLLKGYEATTHWASHEQLAFFGATPVKQRVVLDRNRLTGGGVTSGIDFALALAARIRGEAHAKFIQLSIEYDPHPPFDSGTPDTADAETLERYWALVNKAAPGRVETVKSIAEGLGFRKS